MKMGHQDFHFFPLSFIGNKILRVAVFIVIFSMLFCCSSMDSNIIAAEKEKSSDHFEQICQLTIDLKDLDKYYHIEEDHLWIVEDYRLVER